MVKRTKPRRYYDDQTFAVKVLFFSPSVDQFHERSAWLRDRVGEEFVTHLGGQLHDRPCTLLMINDVAVAHGFIQRFGLEIAGQPRHLP